MLADHDEVFQTSGRYMTQANWDCNNILADCKMKHSGRKINCKIQHQSHLKQLQMNNMAGSNRGMLNEQVHS